MSEGRRKRKWDVGAAGEPAAPTAPVLSANKWDEIPQLAQDVVPNGILDISTGFSFHIVINLIAAAEGCMQAFLALLEASREGEMTEEDAAAHAS